MLGYSAAIVEIVTGLWERYQGVPLEPAPLEQPPAFGETVVASVSIGGGWSGAVMVAVDAKLAERAARALEGDARSGPDARDAHLATFAAELAREFAVMLPGRCQIGSASVTRTRETPSPLPGMVPVLSEAFHSDGAGLVATVLQQVPSGPVG